MAGLMGIWKSALAGMMEVIDSLSGGPCGICVP